METGSFRSAAGKASVKAFKSSFSCSVNNIQCVHTETSTGDREVNLYIHCNSGTLTPLASSPRSCWTVQGVEIKYLSDWWATVELSAAVSVKSHDEVRLDCWGEISSAVCSTGFNSTGVYQKVKGHCGGQWPFNMRESWNISELEKDSHCRGHRASQSRFLCSVTMWGYLNITIISSSSRSSSSSSGSITALYIHDIVYSDCGVKGCSCTDIKC